MELTEKRQDFYSHDSKYFSKFYEIFSKYDMVTLYLGKIDLLKLRDKLESERQSYLDELESIKDIDSKKANNRRKSSVFLQKKLHAVTRSRGHIWCFECAEWAYKNGLLI